MQCRRGKKDGNGVVADEETCQMTRQGKEAVQEPGATQPDLPACLQLQWTLTLGCRDHGNRGRPLAPTFLTSSTASSHQVCLNYVLFSIIEQDLQSQNRTIQNTAPCPSVQSADIVKAVGATINSPEFQDKSPHRFGTLYDFLMRNHKTIWTSLLKSSIGSARTIMAYPCVVLPKS